jgi:hypothetical protein
MFFNSKIYIPNQVCKKLSDFDFDGFYDRGYRFALLDIDNTIAPDRSKEPIEYSREVVRLLQKSGFVCCIVSNAKSSRSLAFSKALGIECVPSAGKPSPTGVLNALAKLNADRRKTVLFGDQMFTDIAAANRAGVYSVLVEPYSNKEIFYVKMKRPFERLMRKKYGI